MEKQITKEAFHQLRNDYRTQKRTVVLCHGVFDMVHPGHIIHFHEAKKLAGENGILAVSITSEVYVRKGPGRPYFNDEMRMSFLASIECIDYVILSEGYTAEDVIEAVEPDFYIKGKEYEKAEEDITGKISEEEALVNTYGGKVYFTSGQVFSSTKLINCATNLLSDELRSYLENFISKYSFEDVKACIERIHELKVLVVGDVIIDEYVYCDVQGLMSKDMAYSARYKASEQYLGGTLAVARHAVSFTDNLSLMSIVGDEQKIHSRLLNELGSKMRLDLVYSNSFSTVVKQRFITTNEKREEIGKIFVINNLPTPILIDKGSSSALKEKLREQVRDFDLVILCDFGHGLVDQEVIDILVKDAKMLAVNCQTNSSNYGMNLITKYKRADFFALDQKELRLAFADHSTSEKELLARLESKLGGYGWLTRGSQGAYGFKDGVCYPCPAFTLVVKDTIGAGDAFYTLASLSAAAGGGPEISTFLGNVAGALAANIVGNKEAIDKVNTLKFVSTLLNI